MEPIGTLEPSSVAPRRTYGANGYRHAAATHCVGSGGQIDSTTCLGSAGLGNFTSLGNTERAQTSFQTRCNAGAGSDGDGSRACEIVEQRAEGRTGSPGAAVSQRMAAQVAADSPSRCKFLIRHVPHMKSPLFCPSHALGQAAPSHRHPWVWPSCAHGFPPPSRPSEQPLVAQEGKSGLGARSELLVP